MQTIHYSNIESFFAENLEFLEQEEAANNLLIGIPLGILSESSAPVNINLYSLKNDRGKIIFSLVQTPPHNYLIYAKDDIPPSTFRHIISELQSANIKASGVIGPETVAKSFASQWQLLTGQSWKLGLQQFTYQLDNLQPIPLSSGKLRLALETDLDVLTKWITAFEIEAMGNEKVDPNKELILSRVRQQRLYLWEDGGPVAMSAVARPTRHGITLNYVYTPKEYRGRGYASSCVYEVSKLMLDQYQFCTLFTDRSNPTSNKIYTRMGYYQIKKYVEIKFI